MAAEVVLGQVCIRTQHELGYAQFAGQQHLCLFGLRILLDTLPGQWISVLNGVGDLFLDKVFFFMSSLFFLEPHFFWGLIFGSLFFFFGFTCSSGASVSFFHLFLYTYICLQHVQVWGGYYDVEYVDLSTLVNAHSS
jgi:hypothetical protein